MKMYEVLGYDWIKKKFLRYKTFNNISALRFSRKLKKQIYVLVSDKNIIYFHASLANIIKTKTHRKQQHWDNINCRIIFLRHYMYNNIQTPFLDILENRNYYWDNYDISKIIFGRKHSNEILIILSIFY